MAVTDWSTNPAENLALGTINLTEGATQIGDINGIARQMMADVRVMYNGLPVAADFIAKTGGTFTGAIYRQAAGAYMHHASTSALSGRWFVQPLGSPAPAGMQEGDFLVEY